jgi:LuxR family transcriptional regulator, regulator of acetate metabolism
VSSHREEPVATPTAPGPMERPAPLVGVGQALRRLRPALSLRSLLRQATAALCESVGFERAALFRLHGHTLVARSVYTIEASERGADLLELGSGPLELGPGLYESEALRRRLPVLVRDATGDRRALATLPGSSSYVAAPLLCHERVIGLMHADRGLSGREVTKLDRDTLAAFAEGFGYALERNVLAERLRAQSERVLALARSTEASVTDLSSTELEPSRGEGAAASPAQALARVLTRRELEVLTMLTEGETNASIAARLVVSEGTVKTHVKHILRKLGVQNRAQAVSHYYRVRARGAERSRARRA